jgi:geranyl-CoA carboxylase alpha subunit
MTTLHKILIANRGEIAVRVIRTARDLGYRTVAVYSEADAKALHVQEADEAICIGAPAVGESYLVADKIIAAAQLAKADAIHPGYGFLSENSAFAKQCEANGIIFIGPGSDAIELMGSKRLSKIAMIEAGVPCIPGYQGADQDDGVLVEKAGEIGFPIMVKASAGGGGRGMRLVFEEKDLLEQIKTARSEAENAFGSGELILERAVIEPRHIEIQVFADNHGNVVYLGERDCSIQRRHQKVVEEAPSPFVDEQLRQLMGKAAVDAAKSCSYRGAGTVEFLVDSNKDFYFLEMNTRLQVEHPVTELITGLDLVEWQLLVASGDVLPLSQDEITLTGHAVEVRLYAEDPRDNFMPQTGTILQWSTPERDGVRVDTGIQAGQVVSPHYDPMIAKVITYGKNRDIAIRKLASAIQDSNIIGVNTNKLFLQNILRHPVFGAGEATTAFIEQHFTSDPSMDSELPIIETIGLAAMLYYQQGKQAGNSWRSSSPNGCSLILDYNGSTYSVLLTETNNSFKVTAGDDSTSFDLVDINDSQCTVNINGIRRVCQYAKQEAVVYLDDGNGHFIFTDITHMPAASAGGAGSGQVKASMDGAIVDILIKAGDTVEAGQTLVVLEAMKMEHQLKAGIDGVIEAVSVEIAQQVKSKQVLVVVAAPGEE